MLSDNLKHANYIPVHWMCVQCLYLCLAKLVALSIMSVEQAAQGKPLNSFTFRAQRDVSSQTDGSCCSLKCHAFWLKFFVLSSFLSVSLFVSFFTQIVFSPFLLPVFPLPSVFGFFVSYLTILSFVTFCFILEASPIFSHENRDRNFVCCVC